VRARVDLIGALNRSIRLER